MPTNPKAYRVMTVGTLKLPLAYNCLINGLQSNSAELTCKFIPKDKQLQW